VLGLSADKLILIALAAIVIVGPQRLPAYAAKLAQWVKTVRTMMDGAKDRINAELGPEVEDIDWKKLDPRQYDPRRIIRSALLDDEDVAAVRVTPARVTVARPDRGAIDPALGLGDDIVEEVATPQKR
jgi:sec-independent protein translocase protein TatB